MSAALWAQEDTGGDDQDDVRDAQNPGQWEWCHKVILFF